MPSSNSSSETEQYSREKEGKIIFAEWEEFDQDYKIFLHTIKLLRNYYVVFSKIFDLKK